MAQVTVKNISNHPQQLRSFRDSIQIAPKTMLTVDDTFLFSYDKEAIKILTPAFTSSQVENQNVAAPVSMPDISKLTVNLDD